LSPSREEAFGKGGREVPVGAITYEVQGKKKNVGLALTAQRRYHDLSRREVDTTLPRKWEEKS